jgi:hypothetical protein
LRRLRTLTVGVVGGSAPDGAEERCRGEERENRRAGNPAGTAALNVATAPVKKLQASLRRDDNREHDEYKRELREYEVDKKRLR